MKKIYILPFLIISIVAFTVSTSVAAPDKELENILSSAESLFKAMKEKNYSKIWFYLSNGSRKSITDDSYKNIMKYEKERGREMGYSREQIGVDFSTGGIIAQAYWNSYLDVFNPDIVLEQSRWVMGKVSKDRAQINVTHRKAEKPAIIQMFKEEGRWRVGLAETFSSSKR
jgi:hypothetical protein